MKPRIGIAEENKGEDMERKKGEPGKIRKKIPLKQRNHPWIHNTAISQFTFWQIRPHCTAYPNSPNLSQSCLEKWNSHGNNRFPTTLIVLMLEQMKTDVSCQIVNLSPKEFISILNVFKSHVREGSPCNWILPNLLFQSWVQLSQSHLMSSRIICSHKWTVAHYNIREKKNKSYEENGFWNQSEEMSLKWSSDTPGLKVFTIVSTRGWVLRRSRHLHRNEHHQ